MRRRFTPKVRNLPHAGAGRPRLREPEWRPLAADETLVQFDINGDEAYLRRVAQLVGDRTDVTARCGNGYGNGPTDLEFLRFVPGLRRFSVHQYSLTTLDGLRHLREDATEFHLGWTAKPVSLHPVGRFRSLRWLHLERQHRGIAVLSELRLLEELSLRSMTLPDLSALLPLERLRSLDIKLGGTKDIRLLPKIGRLAWLELWQIRGLQDIDAIGEVVTLEDLFLQSLNRVERLPSLRRLDRLDTVHLEALPRVTDLSGVAEAPALELLRLVSFGHASPEIVRPFIGHPTLRETGWGFGSVRKNFAAQELVPLDPELLDRPAYEQWMREVRQSLR